MSQHEVHECLRVGQAAPDFTATAVYDQEFSEVKLSNYRGKYVVIFSIRLISPSCVLLKLRRLAIAIMLSRT